MTCSNMTINNSKTPSHPAVKLPTKNPPLPHLRQRKLLAELPLRIRNRNQLKWRSLICKVGVVAFPKNYGKTPCDATAILAKTYATCSTATSSPTDFLFWYRFDAILFALRNDLQSSQNGYCWLAFVWPTALHLWPLVHYEWAWSTSTDLIKRDPAKKRLYRRNTFHLFSGLTPDWSFSIAKCIAPTQWFLSDNNLAHRISP